MKQKRFLLLLLVMMQPIRISWSQTEFFEGYIYYDTRFFDLSGKKDITSMMEGYHDTGQHYYIKNGYYLSLDQSEELIQLFDGSVNTYYFVQDGYIYELDAAQWEQPKPIYSASKQKKKISGFACKAITEMEASGKKLIYFSDKIKVQAQSFGAHRLGNWIDYLQQTDGGLHLQTITYHEDYISVMTAVKIEKRVFEEGFFDVNRFTEKVVQ
jgi:hypothetical protein